ncbi:MAG: hypothetical protein GY854_06525 [Deltaproteobacteria bacterium]|nr:hypothetical protein [Deltaproteobacteria bacterium]
MSRRKIRNKKRISHPTQTQEFESLRTYIMSHELLPRDFVFDGTPQCMELVNESSKILASGCSSDKEVFRAIAILGHAPCQLAIDTLERCTRMPSPFGQVARHALQECTSIGHNPLSFYGVAHSIT